MAAPTAFTLVRTPLANVPRRVVVREVEDITPTYRRIHLSGDFSDFNSLGADDHLRIFFVPQDFSLDDLAHLREHPSREYTPVAWSTDALALDFVLHGPADGPATAWARDAVPGAVAVVGGPRGSLVIDGRPDWWLLAGDRTALPAIRRHLGSVAPGVPADVVVIAEDSADEQLLESPGDLQLVWVRSLDQLVTAIAGIPRRPGDGFAFIAAEQSVVKPGREVLQERGVDLDRAVVKGYWRRGVAEYHAPH